VPFPAAVDYSRTKARTLFSCWCKRVVATNLFSCWCNRVVATNLFLGCNNCSINFLDKKIEQKERTQLQESRLPDTVCLREKINRLLDILL
jgi:hypothetical protein